MSMLEPIHKVGASVTYRYARERPLAEFSCGDCPISESCGQLPRADCPVRLEEVASGNWRTRRNARSPLLAGM